MARSRHLRLWVFALWAMCVVGVGGGHTGRPDTAPMPGAPIASVSILQPGAGPALLPVRAADELRAAAQLLPLRTLLAVGVLGGLVGFRAALGHKRITPARARRALLVRRHAICLRAPPLLRLA